MSVRETPDITKKFGGELILEKAVSRGGAETRRVKSFGYGMLS